MRLLILTHGHIDHAQNAAFLSKELNIPIAMHKDDVDLISVSDAVVFAVLIIVLLVRPAGLMGKYVPEKV